MSDPVVLAVVALVAIAAGIAIGFVREVGVASQAIRAAQDKAARIVAEARAQQKDLILQAKDEQVRSQRETDEEARAKRSELSTSNGDCSSATSSSTSAPTCSRSATAS